MNCMKCGAKIPEDQVFCDHCLSVMDRYPVKPDAHIHLPKRAALPDPAKKPSKKKRAPTPEEQIATLRMKVLRLRLLAVVLAFLVCLIGSALTMMLLQQYPTPNAGRNYTIDITMGD